MYFIIDCKGFGLGFMVSLFIFMLLVFSIFTAYQLKLLQPLRFKIS